MRHFHFYQKRDRFSRIVVRYGYIVVAIQKDFSSTYDSKLKFLQLCRVIKLINLMVIASLKYFMSFQTLQSFCQANALTTVLARSEREARIWSGQCSDRKVVGGL
eukprot:sb/3477961/